MPSFEVVTTQAPSGRPVRWVKVADREEVAEVLAMPNFGQLAGVVVHFHSTGEVGHYVRDRVQWVDPPTV